MEEKAIRIITAQGEAQIKAVPVHGAQDHRDDV
jgi:hypothetical protein